MVRLRKLGTEFHRPSELTTGALINMPYLVDFDRYQDYLDGDITKLFIAMAGNEYAQNVTGARFYLKSGPQGYWQLNLFRAYIRYLVATVFSRSPVALVDDDEIQAQWQRESVMMIRQGRKALEWFGAKGRGILMLERRFPGNSVPVAIDPRAYLPLTDPRRRDITYGHMLLSLWREGQRLETNIPNRATVEIYVPKELADISDGYAQEQNKIEDFMWAGNVQGVVGGRLEASTRSQRDNNRILGLWTFGEDDSIFGSMERNVYETLLALSNARTSLTRDIRPVRIEPALVNPDQQDAEGNLVLDLLDPHFRIPIDARGGEALGYLQSGADQTSAAFLQLFEMALDNLAYVAASPREAFGLNYQANEPGNAINQLVAIFKTTVIDIRDDLGKIFSEMWALMGGPADVKIGWKSEPFASTKEYEDAVRADYNAPKPLITQAFAQGVLGYPIIEINAEVSEADGDADGDEPEGQEAETETAEDE